MLATFTWVIFASNSILMLTRRTLEKYHMYKPRCEANTTMQEDGDIAHKDELVNSMLDHIDMKTLIRNT